MMRLDVFLSENAQCRSRSAASELIKNGCVTVNGRIVKKPSYDVAGTDTVELTDGPEFVSRGGYKLKKAICVFGIDLTDAVCMDIGASTGGFTDCMLKNGAAKVYAVDVGSGQLVPELRCDPRVINMENTNIRYLTKRSTGYVDFVGCDVSFISLSYVFPVIKEVLHENGTAVCLVKPQFEAGKDAVGKKGIVKSPFIHETVLHTVVGFADKNGLYPCGLAYSPIRGGDGNIEFLLFLTKDRNRAAAVDIIKTVAASHAALRE